MLRHADQHQAWRAQPLRQGRSVKTVERDVGPVSDTDLDFTQIWQNTIATLDADGLPARERAFLTLARLAGLLDGTALVKVPNDYTKDVVEQRVRDAVTRALSSQLG